MYPYDIKPVEGSKNKLYKSYFNGEDPVQIGPKKFLLRSPFRDHAESFYNLEVKKDDVWIVTYPRSGTTWTQEMMWLLTHDLDFEKAKSLHLGDKFLFLERSILIKTSIRQKMEGLKNDEKVLNFIKKYDVPGYESIKTLESPRCIKTHLPLSILPPNLVSTAKDTFEEIRDNSLISDLNIIFTKVVYVARNPKDCAVSNFYLTKATQIDFEGEFEHYWSLFQDGMIFFGPHIEHVKEGWELRNHKNLLFLFYEELQQDLPGMIRKMAKFLEKDISDENVVAMANHLSFENMKTAEDNLPLPFPNKKERPRPQYLHFRKGKVGYDEEFKNIGKKADEWVENQIKTCGIPFQTPRANAPYEKLSE